MTDLNKLRSEFEALPSIKEKLNAVYFDETLNSYFAAMINSSPTVKYVQGAWMAWQEKAKAQAVPEDCAVVPKELHIEIALKMAKDRVLQQPLGKDPVWNELVEQAYKDNLQAEQYRLIRDYREMVKASESGAEG